MNREAEEILEITTLGLLTIRIAGQPAVDLGARKAEALLVYLALTGRPQAREVLAELLWPERGRDQALNNLRVALHALRRPLDLYLDVSRESVGLVWPLIWSDAAELADTLTELTAHRPLENEHQAQRLASAINLYEGEFLHGFTLRDSPEFENWASAQRERLHQLVVGAFPKLVAWSETQRQYSLGLAGTARWLTLDPYSEIAHRGHMRLLTYSGQRAAALVHYEQCRELLAAELGLNPEPATEALYRQIITGELVGQTTRATPTPASQPAEVTPASQPPFDHLPPGPPPLLARDQELAHLNGYLEKTLGGQGQLMFVTGEAGMGKSALLQTFACHALDNYPELVVANAGCSRLAATGDPYLPFRLLLAQLTGDLEPAGGSSLFSSVQAGRLWPAATAGLAALLDRGTKLIGPFLPQGHVERAARSLLPYDHPWHQELATRLAHQHGRASLADDASGGKVHLYLAQYTDVLLALASKRPLLLLLDDLQWLDAPSADLLFHLGRTLPAGQIMLVAAYRPEELAAGPAGAPLKKALAEFRLAYGDIWLHLDQTTEERRQQFVDSLLDSEPNRLDNEFRDTLCDFTEGNPLMTIETLRNLQDRGDLLRDPAGRWVASSALAWQELPAKVEGVIEERIGRLQPKQRELLAAASVEGEQFTVQVVAQLGELNLRKVIHMLSSELADKHRLIIEAGRLGLGDADSDGQRLHFFRFRHTIIQQYLYRSLSAAERELFHLETGQILEALYAGRTDEIAPQLAWHFQQAAEGRRALPYMILAGDQARDRYALAEAATHYRQALIYAQRQRDHRMAAQLLMKLGLVYHTAFEFDNARQAFSEGFLLWQQMSSRRPISEPVLPTESLRLDWLRPESLDPALAADTFTGSLVEQLFSGLVELTPQMMVAPCAAESWQIDETGHQYRFRLRRGLTWQDGQPVTARDFIYAWRRVLDPKTLSPHAELLRQVVGARAFSAGETGPEVLGLTAPDDMTLVVELERPSSTFLYLLATWPTYPVPRHLVESLGPEWAAVDRVIGNGPFAINQRTGEHSTADERHLLLRSHAGYRGMPTGNVGEVFLRLVDRWDSSWSERLARYESGVTDLFYLHGSSLPEMNQAKIAHANEYVSVPHIGFSYLIFDASRPPFDDDRVRRALALAIDRQTLADVILSGFEFPAYGGIIPPGMAGHSPDIGLVYDPSAAARLLAEAGFPNGRGFPPIQALQMRLGPAADYLREQWKRSLALEFQWEMADWSTMVERLAGQRPHLLVSSASAAYPDPLALMRWQTFASQFGVWRNPPLVALLDQARQATSTPPLVTLLEKARRATSQTDRLAFYAAADKMLIEQAAVVPLTYLRHHLLLRPRLKQFPLSPLRWWYWQDVVVQDGEDATGKDVRRSRAA